MLDKTWRVFIMSKYNFEFKKQVVEYYLSNKCGYKLTGDYFSICKSTVKKWIRSYLRNGYSGLKSNENTVYDGNYKLNVIEYMFNNNLSAEETAYRFNLAGADRILKWVEIYNNEGIEGLNNHSRGRPKNMSRNSKKQNKSHKNQNEDLEKEIEILRAENAYLKKLNALVQERIKRENKKK